MVEINHEDDDSDDEPFDLTIRVPGVAYDIGQPGFPRVLVVQQIAPTVTEYDEGRDGKGQAEYLKNALVRTTPSDRVFQCVYLPDGPLGGNELKDPSTRYPVPESRLIPLRAERADPIDDGPTWTPREAVQVDVLEDLFSVCRAFSDGPSMDALEVVARESNLDTEVIRTARETVDARDFENVPDDMTLPEYAGLTFRDDLSLDDSDGPHMELTDEDDEADGDESGDDNDADGELPDFDPDGGN